MSARQSYSEKLRDPRWQRRRLEVFDRAGWACEECGDKTTTLNAHHRHYERNAEPWDYPDEFLRCLCETCHGNAERSLSAIRRLAGALTNADLRRVGGFLYALLFAEYWREDRLYAGSDEFQRGIAEYCGTTLEEIQKLARVEDEISVADYATLKLEITGPDRRLQAARQRSSRQGAVR